MKNTVRSDPSQTKKRLPRQALFYVRSFIFIGTAPAFPFFPALVVNADENTRDQRHRDDPVDPDRDRDQPSRRRDRRHIAESDGRDQHKGVPEPVAEGRDSRLEHRKQKRRPDHRDHQPGKDLRRVGFEDDPPEQTAEHHVFQGRVDPGDALHQEQKAVDRDLRLDRFADLGHQFREQNQVDHDQKHAADDRARRAPVPAD